MTLRVTDVFRSSSAEFRPDGLFIGGTSIVETWEQPVQRGLGELAARGRRVLEIGYGLGMASDCLNKLDIDEHYLIEAHEAHPAVPGWSICSMRVPCAGDQRRAEGTWDG